MRKEKQKIGIRIQNFDMQKHTQMCKHGQLLPNTVRALICGPSNCGKTNVMLSLLTDLNGLRFKNVYVYSKSLQQEKYEFLRCVIKHLSADKFQYFGLSDNDHVIDPSDAQSNSVIIFDDVACEKQDKIRNYFCMGRHNGVDCFYLSQTYSKIPKQLIRDNANVIILFKQDDLNLKHVYEDHVNTDMTLEQFKTVCTECWKDRYGFLVIIKDCDINNGRYRSQFDTYIIP